MKKFNDKELSLILSQHEAGMLCRGGGNSVFARCCIIQCAKESVSIPAESIVVDHMWFGIMWFDANYQATWTSDEFLAQMEKIGLA
jgi:hypothetical protein